MKKRLTTVLRSWQRVQKETFPTSLPFFFDNDTELCGKSLRVGEREKEWEKPYLCERQPKEWLSWGEPKNVRYRLRNGCRAHRVAVWRERKRNTQSFFAGFKEKAKNMNFSSFSCAHFPHSSLTLTLLGRENAGDNHPRKGKFFRSNVSAGMFHNICI